MRSGMTRSNNIVWHSSFMGSVFFAANTRFSVANAATLQEWERDAKATLHAVCVEMIDEMLVWVSLLSHCQ